MENSIIPLEQIVLEWMIAFIEKELPNYLTNTDPKDRDSIFKVINVIQYVADNNEVFSYINTEGTYYFSIHGISLAYVPRMYAIIFYKPINGVRRATESFDINPQLEVPEPPPPPIKPELQISEEDYYGPLRWNPLYRGRRKFSRLKSEGLTESPIGRKPKSPVETQPQKSTFFSRLGWLFFGE